MKFGLLISQSLPILQCMQISLKRNAVLVSGLAIFFCWSFEFAKHDPSLRSIIPFGDDPYDSVSSFGVITATLLALVSLTRAFFPQGVGRSGRPIYVLRAQLAVAFCILVTLAAEGIAMLRHTTLWVGGSGVQAAFGLPGSSGSLIPLDVTYPPEKRGSQRAAAVRATGRSLVGDNCCVGALPRAPHSGDSRALLHSCVRGCLSLRASFSSDTSRVARKIGNGRLRPSPREKSAALFAIGHRRRDRTARGNRRLRE
jgi:hypothetical protein